MVVRDEVGTVHTAKFHLPFEVTISQECGLPDTVPLLRVDEELSGIISDGVYLLLALIAEHPYYRGISTDRTAPGIGLKDAEGGVFEDTAEPFFRTAQLLGCLLALGVVEDRAAAH